MEKNNEKLTYEQLNDMATQLSIQNQRLTQKLNEINYSNAFTRLDFLFKVIKYSNVFSVDFIAKCINEIEETLTIVDNNSESDTE